MDFLPIFIKMVELFLIVILGYIANKAGILGAQSKSMLSKLVLNVTMPCTIMASVLNADVLPSISQIGFLLLVSFSSYLVMFFITEGFTKLFRLKGRERAVALFAMMFANVGFIGYPVTQAVFGDESIFYTTVFNLPFNLLCYSLGVKFIQDGNKSEPESGANSRIKLSGPEIGANSKVKLSEAEIGVNSKVEELKLGIEGNSKIELSGSEFNKNKKAKRAEKLNEIKKLLLSPALLFAILALVLALIGFDGSKVSVLGDVTDIVGAITTPAALMIIGSALAEMPVKEMFNNPKAYLITLVVVVITPIIMYLIYKPIAGADPLLLGEVVIIPAMPVATAGTMLCVEYGGDEKFMAQCTFLSTLASVVTIPLIAMIL